MRSRVAASSFATTAPRMTTDYSTGTSKPSGGRATVEDTATSTLRVAVPRHAVVAAMVAAIPLSIDVAGHQVRMDLSRCGSVTRWGRSWGRTRVGSWFITRSRARTRPAWAMISVPLEPRPVPMFTMPHAGLSRSSVSAAAASATRRTPHAMTVAFAWHRVVIRSGHAAAVSRPVAGSARSRRTVR